MTTPHTEKARIIEILKLDFSPTAKPKKLGPLLRFLWDRRTAYFEVLLDGLLGVQRAEHWRFQRARRAAHSQLRKIATSGAKPLLVFVVPYDIVTLRTGGGKRIAGLAQGLSAQFEVCLLSLSRSSPRFSVRSIAPDTWMVAIPTRSDYLARCEALKKIGSCGLFAFEQEVESPSEFRDVLPIVQPHAKAWVMVSPFSWPPLKTRIAPDVPVIYDMHDDVLRFLKDSLGCHNADSLAQAANFERELISRSTAVALCTSADMQAVSHRAPELPQKARVIPNGVNVESCAFVPPHFARLNRQKAGLTAPIALFAGAYHKPNLEAIEHIIHELAPATPQVIWVIMGVSQDKYEQSGRTPPGENVLFLGAVSEEVKATVFALADIAVAPMKTGTGSSLKIPEYVAHGKIVIGTPIGLRGFEALTAYESVIATDDMVPALQQVIARLQTDPESYTPACHAARNWVKQNLDWSVVVNQLLTALSQVK